MPKTDTAKRPPKTKARTAKKKGREQLTSSPTHSRQPRHLWRPQHLWQPRYLSQPRHLQELLRLRLRSSGECILWQSARQALRSWSLRSMRAAARVARRSGVCMRDGAPCAPPPDSCDGYALAVSRKLRQGGHAHPTTTRAPPTDHHHHPPRSATGGSDCAQRPRSQQSSSSGTEQHRPQCRRRLWQPSRQCSAPVPDCPRLTQGSTGCSRARCGLGLH